MLVEEHTRRNILVRKAEFPPYVTSDLHWHENLEICMLLNSHGTFTIGDETVIAVPGDIMVIDEFVPHRICTTEARTDIIIVHLRLSCFIEQGIRLERIKPYISLNEIESVPMLSERLNFLLKTLCDEKPIAKAPCENPFLYSAAASLYYLLMRHFAIFDRTAPKNTERAEFYNITEYINANFKNDITVNSISAAMYISRKKVSEIFKTFSGLSINDYISSLRIRNVNYLLKHGSTVSEAAYESGFQSLRTFNDLYKKQMGMSPTEYIKKQ